MKNIIKNKTAYIDFDGTVVDVWNRYFGILNKYLDGKSKCNIDFKLYKKLKRAGYKEHEIILRLCDRFLIDIDEYTAYKRSELEKFIWLKRDDIIGNPKIAYRKLKAMNYKVKLLTQRFNKINFHKQISRLDLRDCFDDIIVVTPKCNTNMKLEYLKDKVNHKDIIIGDGMMEIEAAERLGLRSFFVKTGLADKSIFVKEITVYDNYNSVVNFVESQGE